MAVKFIAAHHRYSGLSTDSKPTSKPVGSKFRETDTGKSFDYDGTTWNPAFPLIDGSVHGAQATMDIVHYEIHEGDHYTAPYKESIGSGSLSTILIETPASASTISHFVFVISTSAAGSLEFRKESDGTAGTAITPENNNQVLGGTANTTISHNGAATSAGTLLECAYLGGGASSKSGGAGGSRIEWELDQSAKYILEFVSSAASVVAWNLFWYEED